MRDLQTLRADLLDCLAFYTRLPIAAPDRAERNFGEAQWAAPVAGLVVAIFGGLAFWICDLLNLPPAASVLIAVGATMLASGALHEDGLSDTADGFGGGSTKERKLEILRDSRIGSYGAAALIFSILLRSCLLFAIGGPASVTLALVASHSAGRALMPFLMHWLPPARSDGLSAGVGIVSRETALAAIAIGVVALLPLGLAKTLAVVLVLAAWTFAFGTLCRRQVGGHTGDTLGALEQGGEILVLLTITAFLPTA